MLTRNCRLMPLFVLLLVFPSAKLSAAQAPPDRNAQIANGQNAPTTGYPALAWRYEIEGQIFNAPVLAGNTLLIVTNAGYLYALDKVTGELRWRLKTRLDTYASEAIARFTVAGDLVFVTDVVGKLQAVELETGAVRWARDAKK